MKSAISIQEFKPFAENILYLKDDKQWLWLGNELREEPVELILFLGKYKGFTKEDVLSDIRKRAPNALNGDLRKMSSLERYLSGFDPKVIKDLSNGEQTVMEKFDFYAGHIKFVNSSIQPEYLVVNHSILPKELIEYAKENGDLDIDWYNKAIMDKSLFDLGIGIRFIMEIMIERNGVPDYKGISKLIDEEKFGTDKLRITGRWDSKDEIMSVFTPISSGLNTLEYINELKDESEKMLGYASHALAQTFYINENPSINNMEISKTLH